MTHGGWRRDILNDDHTATGIHLAGRATYKALPRLVYETVLPRLQAEEYGRDQSGDIAWICIDIMG